MAKQELNPWTVYMIRCRDGSLYTGITTDLDRRVEEHRDIAVVKKPAAQKGAKALRGKGPLELVFSHSVEDRSIASKLEYWIKQLKKSDKESLVAGSFSIETLKAEILEEP